MKNSIDVLCPNCNQQFQAPSQYENRNIVCVHCKASITAVKAPSAAQANKPPINTSMPIKDNSGVKIANPDSLWDKVNSFRFKDLTKKEIIMCVAGACLLVGSIMINKKASESKRELAQQQRHTEEHNKFVERMSEKTAYTTSSPSTRPPESSGWDGGVNQVKRFIKDTAKEPSSIEFIEWSPVEDLSNGEYRVRAKYRGENGFGGFTVENKIFYLRFKEYDYQVYKTQNF